MKKLLKNIKLKQFSKNKIHNYLIYAVGEIAIIIIGVFIAVQFNNWNESRITKIKEQVYLKGLKIEFESSQKLLKEKDSINKNNIEAAKKLITNLNINFVQNEIELSKLINNAFGSTVMFNPQNSLLEEMINSGSLRDISNNKLRELLASWDSNMKTLQEQENLIARERQNVLNRIRENGSIRIVFDETGVSTILGIEKAINQKSNQNLIKSSHFENDLLLFIITSYSLDNSEYKITNDNIIQILDLIESEIEK